MKYIYIDESGDLGDKYSSSKYSVLAAIVVNNPKNPNRIIKETKIRYSDIIGRDLKVKGNETDRNVLKKVLGKLDNVDYEVLAIFLDKQNRYNVPGFYNHNVLYDALASKLAEKIIL